MYTGFPDGTRGKEPSCDAGDAGDMGLIPGSGTIPWRRAWQPTPVILLGKSHGECSLAGCGPWGHEELDMTTVTEHTHVQCFFRHNAIAYLIDYTVQCKYYFYMPWETKKFLCLTLLQYLPYCNTCLIAVV